MTVFGGHPLTVHLDALDRWLSGGGTAPDLEFEPAPRDLLTGLAASALQPQLGEIEWLDSVPSRDDSQFGDRPFPPVRQLHAWLYAPDRRIACAVHTPDWQPPATNGGAGRHELARANWDALLHEHFHAHFRSGNGWTGVGAVAMPLRVPFDEPGLKIQPLLVLRTPVSSGQHYLSETMTASVRHGAPHVTRVQVFSAALYVQARLAAGHSTVDLTPQQGATSLQR